MSASTRAMSLQRSSSAGLSGRLRDAVEDTPERLDPNVLAALAAFRHWTAVDLAARQRERVLHRERLWRFFARFDLLLTPTTPVAAWELGPGVPPGPKDAPAWPFFTYPFNLSGQPAATVPCGFTRKGLPVGLQIVVRPLEEPLLLALMRLAEDTFRGAPPTPTMAATAPFLNQPACRPSTRVGTLPVGTALKVIRELSGLRRR